MHSSKRRFNTGLSANASLRSTEALMVVMWSGTEVVMYNLGSERWPRCKKERRGSDVNVKTTGASWRAE